jgi:hypothetical protein
VSGLNRLVVAVLALGLLLFALLMVGDLLAAIHDAQEYTHGRSLGRYLLENSLLILIGLTGAVGGLLYSLGGDRFRKGSWLAYGSGALLALWLLLYSLRS